MGTSPALVPTAIARTMRKLRTRIIPFVFVLFMIHFLDRANIAFAALTMNKELAIASQQYGFVAIANFSASSEESIVLDAPVSSAN